MAEAVQWTVFASPEGEVTERGGDINHVAVVIFIEKFMTKNGQFGLIITKELF